MPPAPGPVRRPPGVTSWENEGGGLDGGRLGAYVRDRHPGPPVSATAQPTRPSVGTRRPEGRFA